MPNKMSNEKERFSIAVTKSDKKELQMIAKEEDRSVNYVINKAIREYIFNYRSKHDK